MSTERPTPTPCHCKVWDSTVTASDLSSIPDSVNRRALDSYEDHQMPIRNIMQLCLAIEYRIFGYIYHSSFYSLQTSIKRRVGVFICKLGRKGKIGEVGSRCPNILLKLLFSISTK